MKEKEKLEQELYMLVKDKEITNRDFDKKMLEEISRLNKKEKKVFRLSERLRDYAEDMKEKYIEFKKSAQVYDYDSLISEQEKITNIDSDVEKLNRDFYKSTRYKCPYYSKYNFYAGVLFNKIEEIINNRGD